MAATRILSENRDKWRGTVLALFQPGEETAGKEIQVCQASHEEEGSVPNPVAKAAL